jgi:predicted MFS family arabinose efflux permease
VNGFALGAATTLYLAFFVEALPQNENRHHAMGIYMGCLAIGHSSGSFLAGVIADRLGYPATFQTAAFLALLCAAVFVIFRRRLDSLDHQKNRPDPSAFTGLRNSLRAVAEPEMASVVVVALFLNLLHQVGNVFLPLYGLAVGLTLTQIGIIKGLYALCNSIARPLSGFVVPRMNSKRLCNIGLVIQAVFLMLVPLYSDFGPLLTVFLLSALMRAVVVVSNAISLVQDVDQTRLPRGLTSGVYNAAGDLGNILGPSAGGLIGAMTGIAGLFVVGPLSAVLLFLVVLQGIRLLPRSPVRHIEGTPN